MFDIGYGELLLIAIVALLVLGPDKLPGTLRTAGLWIARLRRSFDRIRGEIEQEVGADEIRRQIHNQLMLDQAAEIRREIDATAQAAKETLHPELEPAADRATALARATSAANTAPAAADPSSSNSANPANSP